MVYVDEFQNFATESFVQMLSEARKYQVFLTMAEQSTSQQEDQRLVHYWSLAIRICLNSNDFDRGQNYAKVKRIVNYDDNIFVGFESLIPSHVLHKKVIIMTIDLQTRVSDAKHWSWTLKHDIVKFKEYLATAMSMRPSTNGWTIQQERFFSNQSAQEHALLIDAGNFFKAAHNLKAPTNINLEDRVRHLRNIHEHWEDNRKYFTGEKNDLSGARTSVKWFKTNFPDANPYSRGWSNATGYDIGGILNPDNVLREIASIENVVRQKFEELRAD